MKIFIKFTIHLKLYPITGQVPVSQRFPFLKQSTYNVFRRAVKRYPLNKLRKLGHTLSADV